MAIASFPLWERQKYSIKYFTNRKSRSSPASTKRTWGLGTQLLLALTEPSRRHKIRQLAAPVCVWAVVPWVAGLEGGRVIPSSGWARNGNKYCFHPNNFSKCSNTAKALSTTWKCRCENKVQKGSWKWKWPMHSISTAECFSLVKGALVPWTMERAWISPCVSISSLRRELLVPQFMGEQ